MNKSTAFLGVLIVMAGLVTPVSAQGYQALHMANTNLGLFSAKLSRDGRGAVTFNQKINGRLRSRLSYELLLPRTEKPYVGPITGFIYTPATKGDGEVSSAVIQTAKIPNAVSVVMFRVNLREGGVSAPICDYLPIEVGE